MIRVQRGGGGGRCEKESESGWNSSRKLDGGWFKCKKHSFMPLTSSLIPPNIAHRNILSNHLAHILTFFSLSLSHFFFARMCEFSLRHCCVCFVCKENCERENEEEKKTQFRKVTFGWSKHKKEAFFPPSRNVITVCDAFSACTREREKKEKNWGMRLKRMNNIKVFFLFFAFMHKFLWKENEERMVWGILWRVEELNIHIACTCEGGWIGEENESEREIDLEKWKCTHKGNICLWCVPCECFYATFAFEFFSIRQTSPSCLFLWHFHKDDLLDEKLHTCIWNIIMWKFNLYFTCRRVTSF